MSKIFVFTGKGGVGKSTVASAHALKASEKGKKTLIVSTDMAHNLSDIFEMSIGKEEVLIKENLWGLEIDANYEMEKSYGSVKNAFSNIFSFDNKEDRETFENITVFPGLEELLCLLRIKGIYEKGFYDYIIIDCAPTGETLTLLKFPEIFSWFMKKFFAVDKVIAGVLRPVSGKLFKINIPSREALNDIEKLYLELIELQNLLRDKRITAIRIVSIPEKMVIEETKRNYMYLNLYNFNVDGVYINRVLPEEVDSEFFRGWKEIQGKFIKEHEEVFTHIPIRRIKWYGEDINGIVALKRIVEDSLDEEVLQIKCNDLKEGYEQTKDGYKLNVYMPFVNKEDIELNLSNTDVILKANNFKRNIPIPNSLIGYAVSKAGYNDDYLSIEFRK